MRCGLTRDERRRPFTGVEPVGVVEQFHDLDLCEGDAELEQRLCEARSQDPMDAAFRVDDLTS